MATLCCAASALTAILAAGPAQARDNGTSLHLSGELFQSLTGAKTLLFSYKGSAPAMRALLGQQVDLVFENIVAAAPLIQAGKLRVLGVTSSTRASSLSDVPTLSEAGLSGYEIVSWQAVFAPAGTPQPVLQRLASNISKIIRDPEISARVARPGVEPSSDGPAGLGALQKFEVAKWAKLIKASHSKLE